MKNKNQFKALIILLLALYFSISLRLTAQISEKGIPISFSDKTLKPFTEIPFVIMPSFDISRMIKEDSILLSSGIFQFRFAKGFDVSYSLNNSGVWETLSNGDKIWRLGIKSPGAYGIIVFFSEYNIPDSAKVFIFNTKKTHFIGAFTSKNNTEYKILPTETVESDEIIIEYFEPKCVEGQGKLTIGNIGHDYKGIVNGFEVGGYGGTPLSCEINTICVSPYWQNEKHAINRICYKSSSDGNYYLCSAALINNTAHDGTPYDLTANHCICDNNEANSVVALFNYESPTCITGTGSLSQTISVATLVASSGNSDFALIQLSSTPPASYSPYYLGWDNTGNTPSGTITCIHHPVGAVKKISTSTHTLSTVSYDLGGGCTTGNKDCWFLNGWNTGDIEHGSSGAPLLDNYARIIGQVYGDEHNIIGCPGTTLYNLFGRFYRSWTGDYTPSTQLSHWLDPCTSSLPIVDGGYPVSLSGPSIVCSSGAVFKILNLPNGYIVNWNSLSSNLQLISASADSATISPISGANGSGWVQPTISSSAGCPYTLPRDYVWAGVPSLTSIYGPSNGYVGHSYVFGVNPYDSSARATYNWSLVPLKDNIVYPDGDYAEIEFNSRGAYRVYVNAQNTCGTTNSIWKGISIIPGGPQFILSPNPASTTVDVTISSENSTTVSDSTTAISNTDIVVDNLAIYTVCIYNNFGTLINTTTKSGNTFSIPLNNLKNGNYIITISDVKRSSSQLLIVQH